MFFHRGQSKVTYSNTMLGIRRDLTYFILPSYNTRNRAPDSFACNTAALTKFCFISSPASPFQAAVWQLFSLVPEAFRHLRCQSGTSSGGTWKISMSWLKPVLLCKLNSRPSTGIAITSLSHKNHMLSLLALLWKRLNNLRYYKAKHLIYFENKTYL